MVPQPKRKLSKGRRDRRRAQDALQAINLVQCSNCGRILHLGHACLQVDLPRRAQPYLENINRATGDANRFSFLLDEYIKAKDVTRRRLYLEAMGAVLPKLGSKYIIDPDQKGLLPFLNLNEKAGVKQRRFCALLAPVTRDSEKLLLHPLPEPSDGLPQPVGKRNLGAPAQHSSGRCGIDDAAELLAGLARAVPLGHARAAQAHQVLEQRVDVCLAPGPEIQCPAVVARERREVGPRHVAHVDIVARLLPVAVDHRLLSSEQFLGEDGDDAGFAMRVLTRPIDVAVTAGEVRNAVDGGVEKQIALACQLGHAVGTHRFRLVGLRRGKRFLLAVDGAAGGGEEHAAQAVAAGLTLLAGSLTVYLVAGLPAAGEPIVGMAVTAGLSSAMRKREVPEKGAVQSPITGECAA